MSYALPNPATTKMVYPSVASLDDAVIQFWLDRVVGKDVDQSWPDYGADAQMAAAVHRLTRAGALGSTDGETDLAGVSDFRSAQFQVKFGDAYLAQQAAGGWESTQAGQEYLELLTKFASGPRVTPPGTVTGVNAGFNGFAGPMGYPARLFP